MKSNSATRKERSPRALWFDPRFAIGVVLVIASVAGVFAIVSSSDKSVQVFAARTTLVPGDSITVSDLAVTRVRLGDLDAKYLRAADVPANGLLVSRTVAAGELVPASAVGSNSAVRLASVVVAVQGALPKSVDAGSTVDLWMANQQDDRTFGPPTVLAPSALVVRVIKSDGIIAGQGGVSVELLVPRSSLAGVLEATANASAISLVPSAVPARN